MEFVKLLVPPILALIAGVIIERYRNRLKKSSIYSEFQFNLYITLWNSLYDLKIATDVLWELPNIENLRNFAEQLQKTDYAVNSKIPLIEPSHLHPLRRLMASFWNFHIGTERLANFRYKPDHYRDISHEVIRITIQRNRGIKNQYDREIEGIARLLTRQLRGS